MALEETSEYLLKGLPVHQLKKDESYSGVRVYRALLTQTGMDAPEATVLENTLGGTVVWSYADFGCYVGTLVGAFASTRMSQYFGSAGAGAFADRVYWAIRGDADSVYVYSAVGYALTDEQLNNNYIEILVYPS